VVLAAFGAVVATRGWFRRGLGVLIVLAAAVVLAAALHPPGATSALQDGLSAKGWSSGGYQTATAGWRWVAMFGSALSIAAGGAISLYGARWATMGRAYDAPTTTTPAGTVSPAVTQAPVDAQPLTEADVWREIDQGRDPTHGDGL
jgi:uncharacterized membrane protein (TIGR02234 family)